MKESFERMQDAMMAFVDIVNASHSGGVEFGIKHRLYPAEIHTVVAIGDAEGIGVTRLAMQLGVSKPTISERIRRLVKKGVVSKEKEFSNAKAVSLRLTADGRVACECHRKHHQNMYDAFRHHYGELTQEKIEQFGKTFLQAAQFVQKVHEHKV